MNQSFFVVELAHSLHGRVKRIQVTYGVFTIYSGRCWSLALLRFSYFPVIYG